MSEWSEDAHDYARRAERRVEYAVHENPVAAGAVAMALPLASLAGMALTAFAIMGVGVLVGAYWAGALIVGVLRMIAAVIFGRSAGEDMKSSEALRFERTRHTLQRDKQVLKEQARETRDFVQREAGEFKATVMN